MPSPSLRIWWVRCWCVELTHEQNWRNHRDHTRIRAASSVREQGSPITSSAPAMGRMRARSRSPVKHNLRVWALRARSSQPTSTSQLWGKAARESVLLLPF